MRLKKVAAAAVAMVMAVSMLSVPVFAAGADDSTGAGTTTTTPSEDPDANGAKVDTGTPSSTSGTGTASTEVYLKYAESNTQLSVTVPIKVTFAVKDNGEFITPKAASYQIKNNSLVPVYVDKIAVTGVASNYSFADNSAPTGKVVKLTMQAGDANTNTAGLVKLDTTNSKEEQEVTQKGWQLKAAKKSGETITADTLNVKFEGKVGEVDSDLADNAVTLCHITYTIKAGTAK